MFCSSRAVLIRSSCANLGQTVLIYSSCADLGRAMLTCSSCADLGVGSEETLKTCYSQISQETRTFVQKLYFLRAKIGELKPYNLLPIGRFSLFMEIGYFVLSMVAAVGIPSQSPSFLDQSQDLSSLSVIFRCFGKFLENLPIARAMPPCRRHFRHHRSITGFPCRSLSSVAAACHLRQSWPVFVVYFGACVELRYLVEYLEIRESRTVYSVAIHLSTTQISSEQVEQLRTSDFSLKQVDQFRESQFSSDQDDQLRELRFSSEQVDQCRASSFISGQAEHVRVTWNRSDWSSKIKTVLREGISLEKIQIGASYREQFAVDYGYEQLRAKKAQKTG
ncbi:hypothetical protein F511_11105 [Dorcoceras hygrometricum]|uniref:Uncharacterized protein n=1 Tax=Dorcoceras hygrometricum TaxID=472368 RepID=A0A2Z7CN75_9LAMI|nr:hypothetical protein F511_11105 [Dorcoceras hygrometricum]